MSVFVTFHPLNFKSVDAKHLDAAKKTAIRAKNYLNSRFSVARLHSSDFLNPVS